MSEFKPITHIIDYVKQCIEGNKDELVETYTKIKGIIKLHKPKIAKKLLINTFEKLNIFFKELKKQHIPVVIGGSLPLSAILKQSFIPNDMDMYIINNNDPTTINKFDDIIHKIYNDQKIAIVRSPYTLNWIMMSDTESKMPKIQLVLPRCDHISEIFAPYHGDQVCIVYDILNETFVYAPQRFKKFIKSGIATVTDFFVNDKYKERVKFSVDKYEKRKIKCDFYSFNTKCSNKYLRNIMKCTTFIHEDEPIEDDGNVYYFEKNVSPFFDDLLNVIQMKKIQINDNGFIKMSDNLSDLYCGEMFRTMIDIMTPIRICQNCGKYCINSSFCDICKIIETQKLIDLTSAITENKTIKNILITGGRCGLGMKLVEMLQKLDTSHKLKITITTRYPKLVDTNDNITIEKLDLSINEDINNICKKIEDNTYDIIILSAFETLHYTQEMPTHPKKDDYNKVTNDVIRTDSNVWIKTLDEMTDDEIIDPITINIVGITKLIRSYVKCIKKYKSKLLVFITSFEGSFNDKTPFHPVTNATKSAIEQIIHTIKRQVDTLGSFIVMADPGWMYTKTNNYIMNGTISLNEGTIQVLQPLTDYLTHNTITNGTTYKRKLTTNGFKGDMVNRLNSLKQCSHICKFKCSECNNIQYIPITEVNDIVNRDFYCCKKQSIKFIEIVKYNHIDMSYDTALNYFKLRLINQLIANIQNNKLYLYLQDYYKDIESNNENFIMSIFETLTKSKYPYIILNYNFYHYHIEKLLNPIFNNCLIYIKTKIPNATLVISDNYNSHNYNSHLSVEQNDKTVEILTNLKNKLEKILKC